MFIFRLRAIPSLYLVTGCCFRRSRGCSVVTQGQTNAAEITAVNVASNYFLLTGGPGIPGGPLGPSKPRGP